MRKKFSYSSREGPCSVIVMAVAPLYCAVAAREGTGGFTCVIRSGEVRSAELEGVAWLSRFGLSPVGEEEIEATTSDNKANFNIILKVFYYFLTLRDFSNLCLRIFKKLFIPEFLALFCLVSMLVLESVC